MKWGIVADSSCNFRSYDPRTPGLFFATAPLKINVDGTEYIDDDKLDVAELNCRVAASESESHSACPSAGEWAELFRKADNVVAITISANLSASFEAAEMARDIVLKEDPSKNILVVNSRATGGKMELMVQRIDEFIATSSGTCSFEEVAAYALDLEKRSQVLFSLSSYENLVKAGRMPRLAGTLASRLAIRVLGIASDEGTIKIVGPTRGERRTFKKIIDTLESHGYQGGLVYIDHVDNRAAVETLRATIKERWINAEIHVLPCGGLCSYYAEESGIIIGFEY